MCNTVLEAARRARSPVLIRTCYASGVASVGKDAAAVAGAVALAWHVRTVAQQYGVAVILQSETRCQHRLATWLEGLLEANEEFYAKYGEPLYSSHFMDMTHANFDPVENIAVATKYLERLEKIHMWLEFKVHEIFYPSRDALLSLFSVCDGFSVAVSRSSPCLRNTSDSHGSPSNPSMHPLFLTFDDEDGNERASLLASTPANSFWLSCRIVQVLMNGQRYVSPRQKCGECSGQSDGDSYGQVYQQAHLTVEDCFACTEALNSKGRYRLHDGCACSDRMPLGASIKTPRSAGSSSLAVLLVGFVFLWQGLRWLN